MSGPRPGTSSLVVAAFVGPGTVLTCATAGMAYGYALGWVLLFATAAVFVLQAFTAGTGIWARVGVGEAMRRQWTSPALRTVSVGLVVTGLWVGCAAFQMGNLVGAASGIASMAPGMERRLLVVVLAAAAGLVLGLELRVVGRLLAALVALMGTLFLVAMLAVPVDWGRALRGLAVPSVPSGSWLTALALVGTTVVTYNLFLHATAARLYWADEPDPRRAWRGELLGMAVFIPLGGLISFAILATGAALGGGQPAGVGQVAALLEPVAGRFARVVFGLGLTVAGFTSALTAPLAAAAGIRELFGWEGGERSARARLVWGSVLLVGAGLALAGWSPVPAIVAAQAANGVLLPVIAAFVLILSIRQRVVPLPRWFQALGGLIVLVCALLGARTLWWVWERVGG